ncbi:hypothetical protein AB4342_04070, partial [Vibrio breoganii]
IFQYDGGDVSDFGSAQRVQSPRPVIPALSWNLRWCRADYVCSKILAFASMTLIVARITASKDGKGCHSELDSES